jgi:hypothetical protein
MADTGDPRQIETVKLAVMVHEHRDSIDVQNVVKLLRCRLETAKDMLVRMNPWSQAPPGSLLHWQGQAEAVEKLIELIEDGPEELRAVQPEQPEQE